MFLKTLRIKNLYSTTTLAILGCFITPLAQAYTPFLHWNTLSTPHFRIHYANGQTELAQTAARLAERIHGELSPRLNWQPAAPTEMVIADDVDFANGWASPLPFNQIHLIVSPPEAGDFEEITDETDWLYQLIRHEYTHILHLDANAGFPAGVQKILGRNPFLFPALFQPTWVIEGLATDTETDAKRSTGRGVDSRMAMSMRSDVLSGIKPLEQVSLGANMQAWPHGTVSYLYGVHFFEFLRDRYGEESVQRFIKNYRGNIIPFRIHKNARLTTRKSNMDALWAEFQGWLGQRYNPQIDAIRQAGVVEGEAITQGGQLNAGSNLQAMPDGSVYYVRGKSTETHAFMHRLANGQEQKVSNIHHLARFDAHPTAGIVLAQPEFCDSERLYFDLYHIAPGSTDLQRLTHCSRYRQVVWQPDGKGFIALKIVNGVSQIDRLKLDGSFDNTLWIAAKEEKASQLAMSPDGKTLVFVRSRSGAGADLVKLDLATNALTALTHDRNSETYPRFSPDGCALLYSSDHGGVNNLRRLDLATGNVTTLSNTLTGAFTPSQAVVNGPIWFARYTNKGYDLNRLDTPLAQSLPAATAQDPIPIKVDTSIALNPPSAYSPWDGLRPRSWWPIWQSDNARNLVGLSFGGSDPLGVHAYQFALARDFKNDNWAGGFNYLWWDRVIAGIARDQSISTRDNKTALIRNVDTASLGLRLPWLRFDQRWTFTTGLVWEKESELWRDTFVAPTAETYDGVAGVALSWDTTLPIRDSAGPSNGRHVQALWETSDALGRSDYSGHTAALDWREYINIGNARVLAARLNAARGGENIHPYELGGSFNEAPLIGAALPFNQRDIDLRSYADGQFSGHGYQLASLEFRSPLWTIDRTFTTPPIGLSRITGSVFAESARVLNSNWSDWHSGIGGELVGNVVLGYWLPLDLRLGVAHGFDSNDGGTRAYLSMGYAF